MDLAKWMEEAEADAEEKGLEIIPMSDEEQANLYLMTRSYQFDKWFRVITEIFLESAVEAMRQDKQELFTRCLGILMLTLRIKGCEKE